MRSLRFGALLVAARLLCAEEAPSIDKLAEQLGARENTVRREAAYQLSKLGPAAKAAMPALIKALDDPDKQVWTSALGVLAGLGSEAQEAIPALILHLDTRKAPSMRQRDVRQSFLRIAFTLTRIGPAAIPPLITTLQSDDAGARAAAARALGGMGATAHDAIPALIGNLNHREQPVRSEAADALGLIGREAVPALGAALGNGDAAVRAGAALALAQIGRDAQSLAAKVAETTAKETDPAARAALFAALPKVGVEPARAVELLIAGVKDDNEQVRHGAINALYLLRSANAQLIPALVALLRDPNPALSERAATVVGRLGSSASGAVPALLEAARKRTPAPPGYLDALAQIGPAAVPEILRAIEKENPEALTREHWSVKCLQSIGGEGLAPLAQALKNSSVSIRLVAARALGELGPVAVPVIGELQAAANDADPRVRATILGALVNTRTQTLAAASRVESSLKDESPVVRVAAAQLVPHLAENARPLAPALLATLGDSDPAVRAAVVEALSAVGPAAEPALDGLLKMLPTADAETRARVLTVFAGIGPQARAALPEVRNRLKDGDAPVRAAAVTALGKIENPPERLPALLAALDDPALPVRKAAARELALLGDKARDATGKLTPLLQRDDERDFAFDALRQILPRSVPDLVTMLGDRDLTVKIFATQRLARLGPDAHDAIPALEAILQSREREELKRSVTEALKRIKPAP